jgi:hypothetical protein
MSEALSSMPSTKKKKLNLELPYDSKEVNTGTKKDTCTLMFTVIHSSQKVGATQVSTDG